MDRWVPCPWRSPRCRSFAALGSGRAAVTCARTGLLQVLERLPVELEFPRATARIVALPTEKAKRWVERGLWAHHASVSLLLPAAAAPDTQRRSPRTPGTPQALSHDHMGKRSQALRPRKLELQAHPRHCHTTGAGLAAPWGRRNPSPRGGSYRMPFFSPSHQPQDARLREAEQPALHRVGTKLPNPPLLFQPSPFRHRPIVPGCGARKASPPLGAQAPQQHRHRDITRPLRRRPKKQRGPGSDLPGPLLRAALGADQLVMPPAAES